MAPIGLTHPFDEDAVYWPTADTFRLDEVFRGVTAGAWCYSANSFAAAEHGGTHIDAPIHFAEGMWNVDDIPLERLMGPVVVMDVSASGLANPDYLVAVADFAAWEGANGRIAANDNVRDPQCFTGLGGVQAGRGEDSPRTPLDGCRRRILVDVPRERGVFWTSLDEVGGAVMKVESIIVVFALVAGCGPRPPLDRGPDAAESETAYVFDEAPKPIAMVRPEYPDAARQEELEGVVVLRVTIAPDGTVSHVSVVSSDQHVFDEPAVTAVRQWKWQPATREGKPVSSTVSIPLRFALD